MKRVLSKSILFLLLLSSCGGGVHHESESENPPSPSQGVFARPTIQNIEDVSILAGTEWNPLTGVSALDEAGEDCTNSLQVSGNVDLYTPGTYEVSYTARDQRGNETKKKRTIQVLENDAFDEKEVPFVYHSSTPYVISSGMPVSGHYKDSAYPEYVTDGNLSTRYESIWEESQSEIILDLGTITSFSSYKIVWENASALAYQILTSSDGTSFTKVKDFSTKQTGARTDEESCVGKGRYVKFLFTQKSLPAYGYSIYELEIYGTDGLPVPKEEYPDLYTSSVIEDEQFLQVKFQAKTTFDQVRLSFPDWVNPNSYRVLAYDGDVLQIQKEEERGGNTIYFETPIKADELRFEFLTRPFYSKSYCVSTVELSLEGKGVSYQGTFSASSEEKGKEAQNANWNYSTYWSSQIQSELQTFDLKSVQKVGFVDTLWSDNHGKIYDVEISLDGENYETIYRQLHGDRSVQRFYVGTSLRYLRICDYSNESNIKYQLQAITMHSIYPNDPDISYEIPEFDTSVKTHKVGKGSYVTNDFSLQTARYISGLDDSLRGKPVASNGVYQSLLISPLGNAMYWNPLRTKYSKDGLAISCPGEGYFETTYQRSQIVTDFVDCLIRMPTKKDQPEAKVLRADESSITVGYSSTSYNEWMTTFASGSPYTYHRFQQEQVEIEIPGFVALHQVDGTSIPERYVGDGVVIELRRLEGMKTSKEEERYETRFYGIHAPEGTIFEVKNNVLTMKFAKEHYFSMSAFLQIEKAPQYHQAGYSWVAGTKVTMDYQEEKQKVDTIYSYSLWNLKEDSKNQTILALLPHHTKQMASFQSVENYPTIRGTMKTILGNSFQTSSRFYGLVPQLPEPMDESYSREEMKLYLEDYAKKMEGNHMSADAYWQGKALHPLANAITICEELGLEELKKKFCSQLKPILVDWYTYSGADDEFYFYYDEEWGTLYYKVSEFGANFNLADHHFTYGYFALASAVLAMHDETFLSEYGAMCELLIADYLNTDENNELFSTLRNYDCYAGHSWAGGYADGDSGNNQESAGESLNSYAAAYYFACVTGNEEMKNTAVSIYVTELEAVKTYWFDYDKTRSEHYPYAGVGQIYGGSTFYGTFFQGDPTYIYGIQWLPGGESLSGYALGPKERERLYEIYHAYMEESQSWAGKYEEGYQHILWVMLALASPQEALERLETRQNEIANHDEMFLAYYLIHAFSTFENKSIDYTILTPSCATVYENQEGAYAMIYHTSSMKKDYEIREDETGTIYRFQVEGKGMFSIRLDDSLQTVKRFEKEMEMNQENYYLYEQSSSMESYAYLFHAEGKKSYLFQSQMINPTEEDLYITVKDARGVTITTIVVPKDENLLVVSAPFELEGNQLIWVDFPSALKWTGFTFRLSK